MKWYRVTAEYKYTNGERKLFPWDFCTVDESEAIFKAGKMFGKEELRDETIADIKFICIAEVKRTEKFFVDNSRTTASGVAEDYWIYDEDGMVVRRTNVFPCGLIEAEKRGAAVDALKNDGQSERVEIGNIAYYPKGCSDKEAK